MTLVQGLTAFRHLKDFFFDLVKVDGHFTRNIHQDPDNQVLAEALITVAHQFEMFAVAESVESQAEADFLISVGVDCVQGLSLWCSQVFLLRQSVALIFMVRRCEPCERVAKAASTSYSMLTAAVG